jgi:ABC-type sugar transport system substrate-binding protein
MAFTGAAAAALSVSLSSCTTTGTAAPAGPARPTGTVIEMITGAQDNNFYLSMECGATIEARKLGVRLTVAGPRENIVSDQLPLVEGVLVGNPDALVISPAAEDAGSLTQALLAAQQNDTKIVFAGNSVTDANIGASRVASDDAAGGRIAADKLGQLLGGVGSVALITAPAGSGPAAARAATFRTEMAARYPGVSVLAPQSGTTDSAASAARLVSAELKAHKDLGGVLALTQDTTQGAITALGKAHKTGTVKLATFDASPFQVAGLDVGTIQLTIAQEPTVEGAKALEQAVNAVAGKKVVPYVSTPMIAITPQNMNSSAIKPYIYDGTCTSSLRGFMTSSD